MKIPFVGQAALVAGLSFSSVWLMMNPPELGTIASTAVAATSSRSCNIKGNISINSGERIYHVPGQKYYAQTKISPQYGERWFCSEAEAQAAGWRKSRQ